MKANTTSLIGPTITAWLLVDEDDNVAIVSIDPNGPMPIEAWHTDYNILYLMYDGIAEEKPDYRKCYYNEEQVIYMTEPFWSDDHECLILCNGLFVQVNPDKREDFLRYFIPRRHKKYGEWDNFPIELSEELCIFMIGGYDFEWDEEYVLYLAENISNGTILRFGDVPLWDDIAYTQTFKHDDRIERCPYFIYINDDDPYYPHKRVSVPKYPVKFSQLPEHIRKRVIRAPLKFSETEKLQLATLHPCCANSFFNLYTTSDETFMKVQKPDGSKSYVMNYKLPEDVVRKLDLSSYESVQQHFPNAPKIIDHEAANKLKRLKINKNYRDYDEENGR